MRLRVLLATVFAGFAALVIACQSAVAEEPKESRWQLDSSLAVFSDYMFRGFDLFDGTSIQPTLDLSYDTGCGTIGGLAWMHISGGRGKKVESFTEIDYTLSYSYSWEPATLKVGHLWYTYPDSSDHIDDSDEFFGTLELDDSGFNSLLTLSPTVSVYHDYNLATGQYYELGVSHAIEISAAGNGFTVTPSAMLGFASHETNLYAGNGLVQATFGLSTDIKLGQAKFTPSVNYTAKIDDRTTNKFWFGVVGALD